MDRRGKIIVIVAPSGTGKSTLITKLMVDFPLLEESVSCTTRKMRPGEQDGVNYHFISKKDFLEKKESKDFIEWAVVHSNYYGTSKSFVEEKLNSGVNLLFDLDVQGAENFKQLFKGEANIIFLEPPSIDELEKRLLNRGTEKTAIINERISNARNELCKKNNFDFLVLNDDLDRAYTELKNIFSKIISND